MQNAFYPSVILLALLGCTSASADPFGLERPTGRYPGVYRGKQNVIISVRNPQQIATLADAPESYEDATILSFWATGATDSEFARLPILPAVRTVRIWGETALTDKSLFVLARLPTLSTLSIENAGITGKGFEYFVQSQRQEGGARLDYLIFSTTSISREALVDIGRINSLRVLWVESRTACMDPNAVVESLSGHPSLTRLTIGFSDSEQWEESDRVRLRDAMPKTSVWFAVRSVRGNR